MSLAILNCILQKMSIKIITTTQLYGMNSIPSRFHGHSIMCGVPVDNNNKESDLDRKLTILKLNYFYNNLAITYSYSSYQL